MIYILKSEKSQGETDKEFIEHIKAQKPVRINSYNNKYVYYFEKDGNAGWRPKATEYYIDGKEHSIIVFSDGTFQVRNNGVATQVRIDNEDVKIFEFVDNLNSEGKADGTYTIRFNENIHIEKSVDDDKEKRNPSAISGSSVSSNNKSSQETELDRVVKGVITRGAIKRATLELLKSEGYYK